MGLLDKMKNLFTDEVEEPIKSEVIQVEIPAPAKKEPEESVTTVEVKEEKSTPIFFDDDYFKELEQPKKEVKSSYLKEQTKLKEERKHFKPTPIISPVYGVLDKNYNKEDITLSKESKNQRVSSSVTIDEVRKKAYGTLRWRLENTLLVTIQFIFNDEIKDDDLFEELVDDKEEPINIIEDDVNMIEEELDSKKEPALTESELFDMIDSMYEKGE